ncbi:MAG TPA: helix-turn-helix domain-containing protein [Labilithrix sp.]|nr:helix-turn-helix domain-containing protein [Labilithrix sp.]
MAARGRTALTSRKGTRGRESSTLRRAPSNAARARLYTAQDVARFCEVDLKTIHHWADAGKIPHHRTEGRHLRFRRNHLVQFLRHHGYPVHDELASARPTVFFAVPSDPTNAATAAVSDDITKKLSTRFVVRRFDGAIAAIAHLVASEPDALVVSLDDPTWAGARAVKALKSSPDTSWPALVVVADDATAEHARHARDAGADLVIGTTDLGRLNADLARTLALE